MAVSGIVEFLEARIAEDVEIVIRARAEGDRGDDFHSLGVTTMGLNEDPGIFITPRRLMAESRAKREQILLYLATSDTPELHADAWVCMKKVVFAMARIYADHPDFDASWSS
jgi:hypothetical protein